MKTLVIGSQEVRRLLSMEECVRVMREALMVLAAGDAVLPLRQVVRQPDKKGMMGIMPAYLGGNPPILGIKVVSVFPGNHGTKFHSHQGAIQLFETEHGKLEAIIDAGSVTAIRTAATSGVATDLLARRGVRQLTILGSGTQAKEHLRAMIAVRNSINEVLVWSRNYENAVKFAKRESEEVGNEITITPFRDAEDAVREAEIICTTTSATSPVLKGSWLSQGTHVNAVGASVPPFRELDSDAVVRSSFFADRRQSVIEEADDFRIPKNEGLVDDSHIKGEIGEILIGKIKGRTSDNEITIFKSLGIAIEDLAASQFVYSKAVAQGKGTSVEFVDEIRE